MAILKPLPFCLPFMGKPNGKFSTNGSVLCTL